MVRGRYLADIRRRQIRPALACAFDGLLAALHVPIEPVEDERAVAMDDEVADVEDGAGWA